jgi:hypothetical protein
MSDARECNSAVNQKDRSAEERLELIPRHVRDKLDRVGIKLHLHEWQLLSQTERACLRDLPCASADEVERYAAEVQRLVVHHTGRPAAALRRET